MFKGSLKERLEDIICNECLLASVCADNIWYCEAFERLLKLYEAFNMLRRILDDQET